LINAVTVQVKSAQIDPIAQSRDYQELRDRVLLTRFRTREAALDKFDLAVVI
jgi:hypothetical protein